MNSATALIYLIACHGGPAAHFADFAKEWNQNGYKVEILATGPALDKLRHLGAKEFNPSHLNLEDPAVQIEIAEKIASSLSPARAVVTDIGHPLMASVQETIAKKQPRIERLAYYDNPEPFVPGGYSQTAAKVMSVAQKVLFANGRLAKETLYAAPQVPIPLPYESRISIGYFPLKAVQMLASAREARKEIVRRLFLEKHQIVDTGQKIWVYFGGNNDVYFEKAFPAFLRILKEAHLSPSDHLILFQQHPGARAKNLDGKLAANAPLIFSDLSTEEALILSDGALYYQSSMGPQFVLCKIPAIQIGHEPYEDILVRNHLAPAVTTPELFSKTLQSPSIPTLPPSQLMEELGIVPEWAKQLHALFK